MGVFEVLHRTGLVTASFYNWEELRDLSQPGSLNASFMVKDVSGDGSADTAVAQLAAAWLGNNAFNFAFIYLRGTDIAGHAYGWMSEGYLKGIAHYFGVNTHEFLLLVYMLRRQLSKKMRTYVFKLAYIAIGSLVSRPYSIAS